MSRGDRATLLVCVIWACIEMCTTPAAAVARPRVGLVLAGGSARGAAHIGVLEVLEELRVPVDAIAGTSMGSIVGGLYASGMSAEEISIAVGDVDWDRVLSDDVERARLPLRRKQDDRLPFFPFEAGLDRRGLVLRPGIITGQELTFLLRSTLLHVPDLASFDDLPVPFRAVATNLDTGKEHVFDHGSLADAIRASMSLPAIFAPVERDSFTLADGGMVNNLPVSACRDMGVDLIIAVDMPEERELLGRSASLLDVLRATLALLTRNNVADSKATLGPTDVLIDAEVEIESMDFELYMSAVESGRVAARAQSERLRELAVSEEEFDAYLSERRAYTETPPPRIASIRVEGLERVDPRRVTHLIEARVGERLDADQLREDLERVFRLGEFELVDFRLETVPDGADLVIRAHEKRWGPGFIRFGLGLQSTIGGEGEFLLLFDYRRANVNRLGAEFRAAFSAGQIDGVFAELYQPLTYNGLVFVAPYVSATSTLTRRAILREERLLLDDERLEGGVDVGLALGNRGQLRIGPRFGSTELEFPDVPVLDRAELQENALTVGIDLDVIDHPHFPSRGRRLVVDSEHFREALGSDRDFDQTHARYTTAGSAGNHRLVGNFEAASAFNTRAPFHREFQLGGFGRLSGLDRGELQGQVLAYGSLTYYYQLGTLPTTYAGGLYVGGSFELGNTWDSHSAVRIDQAVPGGLAFLAADTLLGPIYVATGFAEDGRNATYFFMGRLF